MTHYNLQIPPPGPRHACHGATGAGELVAATVLGPGLSTLYNKDLHLLLRASFFLHSCMGLNSYFSSSVSLNSANWSMRIIYSPKCKCIRYKWNLSVEMWSVKQCWQAHIFSVICRHAACYRGLVRGVKAREAPALVASGWWPGGDPAQANVKDGDLLLLQLGPSVSATCNLEPYWGLGEEIYVLMCHLIINHFVGYNPLQIGW